MNSLTECFSQTVLYITHLIVHLAYTKKDDTPTIDKPRQHTKMVDEYIANTDCYLHSQVDALPSLKVVIILLNGQAVLHDAGDSLLLVLLVTTPKCQQSVPYSAWHTLIT